MPPIRARALLASAIRLGTFTTLMGAVVMLAVLAALFSRVAVGLDERPEEVREAGYEMHRQLSDAVPGLEVRVEGNKAFVLLPLDVLDADDTIEAWSSGIAASMMTMPGLRLAAELPLDLDSTMRARVMSLIAAPIFAAGLPREAVVFTDARPPSPPKNERSVRMVILLP